MTIADPQSFNRYAYVQNDPMNFVDPTGLRMIMVCESWLDNEGGGWRDLCAWVQIPGNPPFPGEPRPRGAGGRPTDKPPQKTNKEKDPKTERCDALRAQILDKAGKLLDELKKYNPVSDGAGGPVWKPGGHFTEITQLQSGIKNDITRYVKECIKGGGPPAPPLPRWIDEAANRPVRLPVLPPGYVPPINHNGEKIMGVLILLYWIVSEGSRAFPPRNLVPVP